MNLLSNPSSLEGVLIGLVVAALVIVRQFGTRPVLSAWMVLVPLGLAYFGATNFTALDAAGLALLSVNTSLGIGLGVMRGMTFRLWTDDSGRALMQGTLVTLLFWVLTIGVKLGLSVLERQSGLSSASNTAVQLIPVAATLAAQNLVVYLRSRDQRLVTA